MTGRAPWVVLLSATACLWGPNAASAATSLQRVIADLQDCQSIEDPACRPIPGRLAAHGKAAIAPLAKVLPTLGQAGQILALVAIREIQDKRATKLLVKLSGAGDMVVRQMAVDGLGDRAGPEVDRALAAALRAKAPSLRESAALAVARRSQERSARRIVPALIIAARDVVTGVRHAAWRALATFDDPRADPVFLTAVRSPVKDDRDVALVCLRLHPVEAATPYVIKMLLSEDAVVVRDAAATLEAMTGRDYGSDYELWRTWWDER